VIVSVIGLSFLKVSSRNGGYIKGALVTIDAAGTQVGIAEKIVSNGGDYLLAVKGNQPTLERALIEHFEGAATRYDGTFGVFETLEVVVKTGAGEDLRRFMTQRDASYECSPSRNGSLQLSAVGESAPHLGKWIVGALASGVR
jgi:hypothetical protein